MDEQELNKKEDSPEDTESSSEEQAEGQGLSLSPPVKKKRKKKSGARQKKDKDEASAEPSSEKKTASDKEEKPGDESKSKIVHDPGIPLKQEDSESKISEPGHRKLTPSGGSIKIELPRKDKIELPRKDTIAPPPPDAARQEPAAEVKKPPKLPLVAEDKQIFGKEDQDVKAIIDRMKEGEEAGGAVPGGEALQSAKPDALQKSLEEAETKDLEPKLPPFVGIQEEKKSGSLKKWIIGVGILLLLLSLGAGVWMGVQYLWTEGKAYFVGSEPDAVISSTEDIPAPSPSRAEEAVVEATQDEEVVEKTAVSPPAEEREPVVAVVPPEVSEEAAADEGAVPAHPEAAEGRALPEVSPQEVARLAGIERLEEYLNNKYVEEQTSVYLNNGGILKGTIKSEDETHISLNTKGVTALLNRDEIERIDTLSFEDWKKQTGNRTVVEKLERLLREGEQGEADVPPVEEAVSGLAPPVSPVQKEAEAVDAAAEPAEPPAAEVAVISEEGTEEEVEHKADIMPEETLPEPALEIEAAVETEEVPAEETAVQAPEETVEGEETADIQPEDVTRAQEREAEPATAQPGDEIEEVPSGEKPAEEVVDVSPAPAEPEKEVVEVAALVPEQKGEDEVASPLASDGDAQIPVVEEVEEELSEEERLRLEYESQKGVVIVYLTNGGILKERLLEETEKFIVLSTKIGSMKLYRDQIERLEKPSFEEWKKAKEIEQKRRQGILTVILKSGGIIEGKIISSNVNAFILVVDGNKVTIKKEEVKEIRR